MTPVRLERNISKTTGDTLFQRTTNRKWHMGYQTVTWPITSRDPEWSN